MKRKALKLSFDYIDTSERRVVSLVADGVACVPVLGFDAYRRQWRAAPHAFLISCRIARAKEMLAAGPQTVASVATDLGFATPQHFASQFKLATGLTPREWRQTYARAIL